jgi:hypothetical protein
MAEYNADPGDTKMKSNPEKGLFDAKERWNFDPFIAYVLEVLSEMQRKKGATDDPKRTSGTK